MTAEQHSYMGADGTFNAAWLMAQQFPPVKYVIPGVIPEGMSLLVAAPKTGKSWLVLDLAYQLATGGYGLGSIQLDRGRPVLYLALEDGPRRLQDRLMKLDAVDGPQKLFFHTDVPRDRVLDICQEFMDDCGDDSPVIILDTLGKVSPPAAAGESDYQRDYRIGGALKQIADSVPGGAVVVVHHTRKADSEDFLDSVSGTQGLAGSADSIIVLRRKRGETAGSLSVTSRDAAEGQYKVEMVEGVRWVLVGADLADSAEAFASERLTENVGDRMAEVIDAVGRFPEGVTRANLEHLIPEVKGLGVYLQRAVEAGRIAKPKRGLYTPVTTVTSVTFPNPVTTGNNTSNSNNSPLVGDSWADEAIA